MKTIEQIAAAAHVAILDHLKREQARAELSISKSISVPNLKPFALAAFDQFHEEHLQAIAPAFLTETDRPGVGRCRSVADQTDAVNVPADAVEYVHDHHGQVLLALTGSTEIGQKVAVTLRPGQLIALFDQITKAVLSIDSGVSNGHSAVKRIAQLAAR